MKTKHFDEVMRRLKDLSESSIAEIHKDWVQVVMTQFRQHVETLKAQGSYRVLMFYCNWNLHTELNRGIVQDIFSKKFRTSSVMSLAVIQLIAFPRYCL